MYHPYNRKKILRSLTHPCILPHSLACLWNSFIITFQSPPPDLVLSPFPGTTLGSNHMKQWWGQGTGCSPILSAFHHWHLPQDIWRTLYDFGPLMRWYASITQEVIMSMIYYLNASLELVLVPVWATCSYTKKYMDIFFTLYWSGYVFRWTASSSYKFERWMVSTVDLMLIGVLYTNYPTPPHGVRMAPPSLSLCRPLTWPTP